MKKKQTIIFSNSYGPRTGHNFVSDALKIFTNHEVLAHNRSETRLSNYLKNYFELADSIYHKSDKDFFDSIIIKELRSNIIKHSDSDYIMIKNTSFEGAKYLPEVFPDDIHILVLRHPVDSFSSAFEAMDLNKEGMKNKIKKIGTLAGIFPYYYFRKISRRILNVTPDLSKFYIIRYEDLVTQKESVLQALKQKFNSPKSIKQIKDELNNIKVFNSSYFEETGAKHIWDTKERTRSFNPIGRKKHPFIVRKAIEMASKKLTNSLGY